MKEETYLGDAVNEETYLGDTVYASCDSGVIKLRTGDKYHVIYLEPSVYHALVKYVESIKANYDPSPYCQYCGAMERKHCDCGPIAANN
jgi:hypothetical protein